MRETLGYQICAKCVMDTTDPDIEFNPSGVCNHCTEYEDTAARATVPENRREPLLKELVRRIRVAGRRAQYDCVIGVSGGVDSTYVAYVVKNLGLRPLAVHFDNGWDSELAVANIARTLATLNIDLFTYVVDWEEFKDLQLAFLRASVINAEIPTDHGIVATLYEAARAHNIKYILTGRNLATEGVLPKSWVYNNRDLRQIKAIHRRYGSSRLRTFPTIGVPLSLLYTYWHGIHSVPLLNYIRYDKSEARKILKEKLGWVNYGAKHHESTYTLFYQAYILPRKFGIDKRRAHLSSLVCSGQITREQALDELTRPICPPNKLNEYKNYVMGKLGLSEAEFESIMVSPVRSFRDYPSNDRLFRGLFAARRILSNVLNFVRFEPAAHRRT
jgi:N-acetyl sugar amidotransferase